MGTKVLDLGGGRHYEGEVNEAGAPHGQGIAWFPDGSRYEGAFCGGLANGRGILTVPGGDRYEGEFFAGGPFGQGILTKPDGWRFEGTCRQGKPHQSGLVSKPNGDCYAGDVREEGDRCVPHGLGVLLRTGPDGLRDGWRYAGVFRSGKLHGQGVMIRMDGSYYAGGFRAGEPHGLGVLLRPGPDGSCYVGEFADGKPHGQGVQTGEEGTWRMEGEWRRGRYVGTVT